MPNGNAVGPADGNLWQQSSALLTRAYIGRASSPGNVRFELATRAITGALPAGRCRIADIGGGYGRQAILLARLGHEVTVLDADPRMLAAAVRALAGEPESVRRSVRLHHGDGVSAELHGAPFDLVCCHSVLLYLPDPVPLLKRVVASCAVGGLISIISLNRNALAMRSGLQGRWNEALGTLMSGEQTGVDYLPVRADTVESVAAQLDSLGCTTLNWYGIGVFTDHVNIRPTEAEFDQMCELEWAAGRCEPYRSVARTFHLLATRRSTGGQSLAARA